MVHLSANTPLSASHQSFLTLLNFLGSSEMKAEVTEHITESQRVTLRLAEALSPVPHGFLGGFYAR